MNICAKCVKHNALRTLILEIGSENKCDFCEKHLKVLNAESNDFRQLFKALIRFYFSEWEYNRHWGGEKIVELLMNTNQIIKYYLDYEEMWEDFIDKATKKSYEDYDKGVTLFAGYDKDEHPNMLLSSISSQECPEVLRIVNRLELENYFLVAPFLEKIITSFSSILEKKIQKGSSFYRARIGYGGTKLPIDCGFDLEQHFIPYMFDKISAIKPSQSNAGRCNRDGVSVLYLSENSQTSIAEVRPHPGNNVSVGKFVVNQDLTLADFSDEKIIFFYKSDRELDKFITLNTINKLLNQTITPEDRRNMYASTQLIADCIRNMGYDGIMFNSTVGKGKNVALFYPKKAEYIDSNKRVVRIKSLKYKCTELTLVKDDEDYAEDHKDEEFL